MIGTVVGNYKIVEKIGEGGMGSVFRGIDIMLEREVAIKMLRPEFASQPNVVERFRTEAVTLAKLSHPNIATLHSFFRQRDDFFMVMEFVRGVTLEQLIRNHGAMTLDHALPLFCQSLEGIGYAHRMGIIHRDIKPANMMQTPEGSIKVMDFGIARVLGSGRMTRQGAIVGTIEYMSPEQVRGEEGDARSDVYSLGILLYEMLTGRVPFSSTSEFELMKAQAEAAPTPPRTFVAAIPLEVERAIMRSLAKRVEARFQTAAEFYEVVVRAVGGTGNLITNIAISGPTPAISPLTPSLSTSVSKEVLKETRLGGELLTPPSPDWRSVGEIKETRLGAVGDAQFAAGRAGDSLQMQTMPRRASILSNLNWMHYSAAAVVALAVVATVIGTSIAMFGIGWKEKPAEQPAVAAPPPAPRSDEPGPQELPPQTAMQSDAEPSRENSAPRSGSGSPSRQGVARPSRQASSPPQQTTVSQPSAAPQTNPPAVSQQPPPPARRDEGTTRVEAKENPPTASQQPPASTRRDEGSSKGGAKEVGKGVKEGVKKVFGGLFGGGGSKDKDKKKKP